MALTGNETLLVLGQDATGAPAATTFQTTTKAIANLSAAGGSSTVVTALNTVGAGTITAAGIVGKVTSRGGSQSGTPFSDTTVTAAAIISAMGADAAIGDSFQYTYDNTTNATATIGGGTGVTVSVITVIPQNSFVRYLLTYTAAATVTMVGIESGTLANPVSVASGKTLTASNTITLAGTDGTTMTFPSTSATVARTDAANTFTGTQTVGALLATTVNGNTITTGTGTLTLAASNVTTVPAFTDTLLAAIPAVTSANFTAVSTTTLATVTGLSVALVAGGTYIIEGSFPSVSASNAGGLSAELVGTGGLTLTSANITANTYNGTTLAAQTNVTALSSDLCTIANTLTMMDFKGTLVVNAGGTLNMQAAQHTSSATTTTITKGAWMRLTRDA